MERYLKIEDAANKSPKLREILTTIQDAETRIKGVIFNSYLRLEPVDALVARIIEESVSKLPEDVDKEKLRNDLRANANHWMMVVGNVDLILQNLKTPKPRIELPKNEDYKQVAQMFAKGQPRSEDYNQAVLRTTKELVKKMASEPFKSSTVNYKGLQMRTSISLRASTERAIRDEIHQADVNEVIANNKLVWISSHADCSERCEPWQGKLYSTDGTSGTIEGHKYIPIEEATNSNWVITKSGKHWNNSVLVGFNCRHNTIPFVSGTVPVIEYDRKIVKREREITSKMRAMEREIIKGKTAHRLLVEAERDNRLNLPKKYICELKSGVREEYQQMNKQYQKYCENNGRAYYPWRTQIVIDRARNADNQIKLVDNVPDSAIIKAVETKIENKYYQQELKEAVAKGDISLNLNVGSQDKHRPGTANYKQEFAKGVKKSIIGISNDTIQSLVNQNYGTGRVIIIRNTKSVQYKETFQVNSIIGQYYDMDLGAYLKSDRLTIHYSKRGMHVVPARPSKRRGT